MTTYFLSACWGLLILFSCAGWGLAIQRLLLPGLSLDAAQRAAWGVSWAVVAGGVLNLACLISPVSIGFFLGTGFLAWLWDALERHPWEDPPWGNAWNQIRNDRIALTAFLLVTLLLGLQYFGWVCAPYTNWHDDYQAYFAFPKKMLQAGCLGPDPLSERRVTSALGGMSFLDTFILCVLSEENFHIMDSGIGILITAGLLWGYGKDKGLSRRVRLGLIGLFLLCPAPRCNSTALMIAVALFLSAFRWLDRNAQTPVPRGVRACLLALPLAAICTLKSTFIPTCVLLFVAYYVLAVFLSQERRKAVHECLLAGFFIVLFLLPWMMAEHQAFGTWLYPFLGRGNYEPVGGSAFAPWQDLTGNASFIILLRFFTNLHVLSLIALGFLAIVRYPRGADGRTISAPVFLAAILGSWIVFLANMGDNERYFFPMILPAILALLTMSLAMTMWKNSRSAARERIFLALVAGLLIAFQWNDFRKQCEMNVKGIQFGLQNIPLFPDQIRHQYCAMQHAIPTGETVLTRLSWPFLLNFRRNTIFLADYPGAMSMRKGMPFFRGPEALADWLRSLSIRYVAYSYGSEANFQKATYGIRRTDPLVWHRTALHTIDFQENLRQLGNTRKRIYDDGENFVLDLQQ